MGILKRVAAAGHSIGNHTWSHPDIINLSPEELATEISRTSRLINELTGQDVQFFRPPYGSISEQISRSIMEKGLYPILWDLDTNDWDVTITEPIYERVVSRLKEQSIILMHDGGGPRESTVEALPKIIEYLKQEGYQFLTIPEYYQRIYPIDHES